MKKVIFLVLPIIALSFMFGCAEKAAMTKPARETAAVEVASPVKEKGEVEKATEATSLSKNGPLAPEPLVPPLVRELGVLGCCRSGSHWCHDWRGFGAG